MKSKRWIIVGFYLTALNGFAQERPWPDLTKDQPLLNKKGMYVLGGWGLTNMGTGLALMNSSNLELKSFHQMNVGWGAVNLGLATVSWLQASKDVRNKTNKFQHKPAYFKNVFLFNTCLDVGYMGTGFYLNAIASKNKNPDQLKGFGNSLIVQGAFLFLFDGIMYLKHRYLYKRHVNKTKVIDQ